MVQPASGPKRNEEELSPAMQQTSPLAPDLHVLTLEEIGNLAAEGGKPAETLMNVVALIAKRFQDGRLLGVFAGAGSRQPDSGGHARPAPTMRGHAAHGAA